MQGRVKRTESASFMKEAGLVPLAPGILEDVPDLRPLRYIQMKKKKKKAETKCSFEKIAELEQSRIKRRESLEGHNNVKSLAVWSILTLSLRLEWHNLGSLQPPPPGLSDPPTSASRVAGTKEMGFHHVDLAGVELLTSNDFPPQLPKVLGL
ncbi:UPF0764 protein C16orf89 [Plecturocebus cupreus]